jgi:AmmeMemoRadiSam system protein B/AmmeMemoRadiSam system protein A
MSLVTSCSGAAEEKIAPGDVRRMAVAGSFYPRDREALEGQVDAMLEASPAIGIDGEIIALVCPHAGYPYSGRIAAAGFKQLVGAPFDAVIVIGPSHHDGFRGVSVWDRGGYETPLGIVPVDTELARAIIAQDDAIRFTRAGHGREHSVEVELPFLQRALGKKLRIVPMVMGDRTRTTCRRLAEAIVFACKGKKVLIVASSDLYHGHSYEACVRTDARTLRAVEAFQPEKLCEGLASGTFQACGGGPIVVAQMAARAMGADQVRVIARTNSNEVTGKHGGYTVGYGAAVIYRSAKMEKKQTGKVEYEPLDRKAQQELLRMARATMEGYLRSGKVPAFEPKFETLKEQRGVFVTLTKHGQLRGCIGHHESDEPLYKLVPEMAVAAGFRDPRFHPLSKEELGDVRIKVSVYLTNVYRIEDLSEFEMGKHGIIMMKGGRGATYLPEVPVEAGWTMVEEEMESLCRKAGLPGGAWREGAEFYVYKTQVFGEGK